MKPHLIAVIGIGLATTAFAHSTSQKSSQTQNKIQAAEAVGARHVPDANRVLSYAKTEQSAAHQRAQWGYPRSGLLMSASDADAELAAAVTQETASRTVAEHAAKAVNQLKQSEVKP